MGGGVGCGVDLCPLSLPFSLRSPAGGQCAERVALLILRRMDVIPRRARSVGLGWCTPHPRSLGSPSRSAIAPPPLPPGPHRMEVRRACRRPHPAPVQMLGNLAGTSSSVGGDVLILLRGSQSNGIPPGGVCVCQCTVYSSRMQEARALHRAKRPLSLPF